MQWHAVHGLMSSAQSSIACIACIPGIAKCTRMQWIYLNAIRTNSRPCACASARSQFLPMNSEAPDF
eukprot:2243578-Pleurochrysis_carterae.AAC.2